VVELALRDEDAERLVARLLAETGPALLLALPALAEVVIETAGVTRVLTADHSGDAATITADGAVSRWHVAAAGGELGPALLGDRPAEERARPSWSIRWAVPLAGPDAMAVDEPAGRLPDGVTAVVRSAPAASPRSPVQEAILLRLVRMSRWSGPSTRISSGSRAWCKRSAPAASPRSPVQCAMLLRTVRVLRPSGPAPEPGPGAGPATGAAPRPHRRTGPDRSRPGR
jgi:hypothetical protein